MSYGLQDKFDRRMLLWCHTLSLPSALRNSDWTRDSGLRNSDWNREIVDSSEEQRLELS